MIQPKMRQRPMDTSLKARMSPHLVLLTISGLLERAGHEVRVVNGNVEPVEIPPGTDLVGISVAVDVLPQAIEIAKTCRAKGVPVVAGGIGVSFDPKTARPHFDVPYYLFNLFYRKYGHLTERLGLAIGFDRVGTLARRLSYWR